MTATTTQPSSTPRATALVVFWPRLTRFYGIPPHDLQHYPAWLVMQYVEELEKIEAEELLSQLLISDFPYQDASTRRKIHRALTRSFSPEEAEPDAVDVSTEEGKRTLEGMGIGYRVAGEKSA